MATTMKTPIPIEDRTSGSGYRPMAHAGIPELLRRRFCEDLALARSLAAADSEAFDRIITAVEGIGSRLSTKRGNGLGSYRDNLLSCVHESDASEFGRIFDIVLEGRNYAIHTGAAARHLTTN